MCRRIAQFSSEIGTLQIAVAVDCRAVQQNTFMPAFGQLRAQCAMVKWQMHRIPRLGVGVLKVQLCAGWQAGAGAAKGNARGRQTS
ncbi:hypothetical protein D3C84_771490 [compost metagenome]